jgi:alkanesulfonate monooxygenase SsuD/methylene tetrahydromethanopterin reductase-like flavin-dependent oxidoreductase (luciferase family)
VKVGLFLSAHHPPGEPSARHLEQILEQARAADALGYDSVFLGHHYLANSAFLQPVPLAGMLAAVTSRVRIGFGVHLLSLHNPVAVAEELATLDVLSGGRVTAGFGVGYREKEFRAFGIPFADRFKRLDEAIPVIRALWRGETVTTQGRFGSLRDARVNLAPVQPGGPPVWLGAFTARGIRRVAEHDACWLAPPDGDDAELTERVGLLRSALAAEGHGLEREYPLAREGYIAPTRSAALGAAREYLLAQYRNYRSWDQAQAIDPDDFIDQHALVGEPGRAVERLRVLGRIGFTQVHLRMQWDGMSHADAMAAIQLVGERVIGEL